MQALVLAAGEGARLAPLTNRRPKPMLPVGNRPILEHLVREIQAAGVDEIVFVVGHRAERIRNHFGDGDDLSVDISYVTQRPRLGTAHAIEAARMSLDGPFLVLNGDRIVPAEAIERVRSTAKDTGDPSVLITAVEEPHLYGVVEISDGIVTSVEEKPVAATLESDLINAGVYAFTPAIFDAIEATEFPGERSIPQTLQTIIATGTLRAVPHRGQWLDVTRPWDLLSVNASLLDNPAHQDPAETTDAYCAQATNVDDASVVRTGSVIERGSALGPHTTVNPNATVMNSILMADTLIDGNAYIRDAVVGENVTIGPNTTIEGGPATVPLNDSIHENVRFGALIGDNTTIGANVTIDPGTIIGTDVTIQSGSNVSGRIPDTAMIRRG